jgi:hypothetical protein
MVTHAAGRYNGNGVARGLLVRYLVGFVGSYAADLDIKDSFGKNLASCTLANCMIWLIRFLILCLCGPSAAVPAKTMPGPEWLSRRERWPVVEAFALLYPAAQVAGFVEASRLSSSLQAVLA